MSEHKLQKNKSQENFPDDLKVDIFSDALVGKKIDLIVTGSIGAVESARLIRSLRRLSANVQPWLTQGGAQFVTPLTLSWASAVPCKTSFEGSASHIALNDACVIAPCTANFISKLALGITDTPASALVASYLGQKKPVILVPNMHDSLFESPIVKKNFESLKDRIHLLAPRLEEGKAKFPAPEVLADEISHVINLKKEKIMVSLGGMRGYMDDIRYISNYSSGALGSSICEELYRQGMQVRALVGACEVKPRVYSERFDFDTYDDLKKLYDESKSLSGGVLLASVLDYIPSEREKGKVASGNKDLSISFKPTPKLIDQINFKNGPKVGFKLQSSVTEAEAKKVGNEYINKYDLTLCVVNGRNEISTNEHKAYLVDGKSSEEVLGKKEVAKQISKKVLQQFKSQNL